MSDWQSPLVRTQARLVAPTGGYEARTA
jgi:hypothetical protein